MGLSNSENRYIEGNKPGLSGRNQAIWDRIFELPPFALRMTALNCMDLPDGLLDRQFYRPLNYTWGDAIDLLRANGIVEWRGRPKTIVRTGDFPDVSPGESPDLVAKLDDEFWESLYNLDVFDDTGLEIFVRKLLTRFRYAKHVSKHVHGYFGLNVKSLSEHFATKLKTTLPFGEHEFDSIFDDLDIDSKDLPYPDDATHSIVNWGNILEAVLYYLIFHPMNQRLAQDVEENESNLIVPASFVIDKSIIANVDDIGVFIDTMIAIIDSGEEIAVDFDVLRAPLFPGSAKRVHHKIYELFSLGTIKTQVLGNAARVVILRKV